MAPANLLSKLQGLTGPDREVDARIAVAVGDVIMRHSDAHGYSFFHAPIVRGDWALLSNCQDGETDAFESLGQCFGVKSYTASLDAAVALCERVLPDANWNIDKYGGAFKAIIDHDNEALDLRGEGPTPAIALLIAILTALEARENG